ncbi:two-component regulator propeller domain-containing protein [Candidatus Latescibacterota bacterium]
MATCTGDIEDMVEDRDGRLWLATEKAVVAARVE